LRLLACAWVRIGEHPSGFSLSAESKGLKVVCLLTLVYVRVLEGLAVSRLSFVARGETELQLIMERRKRGRILAQLSQELSKSEEKAGQPLAERKISYVTFVKLTRFES